jgi:hypothetical protein
MVKTIDLRAHPMRQVCQAWLAKIKLALEVRHEKFGKYAEEASRFYDGPHDFMWDSKYSQSPGGFLDKEGASLPTFRVTINNIFKAVALFGPALCHKNPSVLVSPLMPAEIAPEALGIDPNDPYGMQEYQMLAAQEEQQMRIKQACSSVKTQYINWVQQENDKRLQSRRSITEAIVAGLGYMETDIHAPPSSNIVMPRSRYLSWWDVVVDPDASYWEDVQWIAIRRVQPVNLTERRFGLPDGELKGNLQSFEAQTSRSGRKEPKQNKRGKSFDCIEYWEVYSKNGFGDRLAESANIPKQQMLDYSPLGDYCWLCVAHDVPYPLNCPSDTALNEDAEAVFDRVQWPIPYWYDDNGWPISRLTFYEKECQVWPISLFKPAIGEMRFVNWCMSFLADKVAASCTTYVGIMKAAGAKIQKELNGAHTPFTVIEIAEALGAKSLNEVVSFLQAPNFPGDIWKMLAEVTQEIDEKTGVTELLQGLTSHSMRSAAEAQIKEQRVSVRPDDMAARVEDFLSEVAVREIQAARWFCQPQHVEPVVGRMGALVWQNYVMTSDIDQVVRDFSYRVEAGSTRKPNKQEKIAQLTELAQYGRFADFALQGQVGPWNAFMHDWCRNADIDPGPYQLQPPQGPSPQEQEMQAQMQMKVQELNVKVAEMQAKLQMEQQSQEQELEHEQDMHELDLQSKKQDIQLRKQESTARQQATKTAARKSKTGAK